MYVKLPEYIQSNQQWVNDHLIKALSAMQIPNNLKESIIYSIEAGGKRLRPILMFAACEAFGGKKAKALPAALALEMIHTYSLIHDDLPAMDDDDFRRGQPTNHKQFDEATAILAGDGLLTAAFQLISSEDAYEDHEKVFLLKELSLASGPEGMVAGQMMDMEAEGKVLSLEELETVHLLKTGKLLTFALKAGSYLGKANPLQLNAMEDYAEHIGLLFQIQDDILDVIGDEKEIGKPVGSDETNKKSTYPHLLGLEGAIKQKEIYGENAKQALLETGIDAYLLEKLIHYISNRTN